MYKQHRELCGSPYRISIKRGLGWRAGWRDLVFVSGVVSACIRESRGMGGWATLKNDFLLAAATTRYPSSICREYNVFAPPMFNSVELLHILQNSSSSVCREYKVSAPPMFKSVELLHILQNNSSSFCREYQVFAPPMFKSEELLHISQTECLRLRILAQAQAEFFSCIRGTGRVLVDL